MEPVPIKVFLALPLMGKKLPFNGSNFDTYDE
jgi:hypothetical protein